MVEMLAARAGLPKPAVYIIDSETPNAFATVRSPKHVAAAVTAGTMRLLNHGELAGVIAHELAHIKHRDTLIASIVAVLAGGHHYAGRDGPEGPDFWRPGRLR